MSQRVASQSILSASASLATVLASAGSMVLVARTLGVEQTGIVTLAVWLVTMAATIAGLGLPTTATRYVAETVDAEDRQGIARRLFTMSLLAALVLLLAFGAAAAALRTGETDAVWGALASSDRATSVWIWSLMGVTAAAMVLGQFRLGELRGRQRFDSVSALTMSSLVLQLVTTWLGCVTFGVAGALAGYAIGAMPMAVSAFRAIGKGRPPSADVTKRMRRFALFTWIGSIMAAFVWARIEVYFLQRYEGFEAVGLFTAGLTLASLATQGPLLLTGALLPHFARARATGATEQIYEAYASATRIIAALAFPAGLGLAAIMPVALPLIFGEAFRPAVPVASVLVIASAIGAVSAVGTHLVNAYERSDFIFVSSLCGAVLALGAGLTLIPAFGLIGAGAARAVIQLAMVGAGMWFISRRMACPAPFAGLGRLMLCAILAAMVARLSLALVPGVPGLALAIPAAIAVYFGAVRYIRALTPSDLHKIELACSALPRPLGRFSRPVLLLVRNS